MIAHAIRCPDGSYIVDTRCEESHAAWWTACVIHYALSPDELVSNGYKLVRVKVEELPPE